MNKVNTLLITILIALSACEKDEYPEILEVPSKLLVAIKENNQVYFEFQYDSLNRLVQVNSYYADTNVNSVFYRYNQANDLIEKKYDGFIENFEYSDNGELKTSIKFYPGTNKEWKTEYQYTTGKIVKGVTFFNGSETGYINYRYDSRGNTIERNEFLSWPGEPDFLDKQFKFGYDDKINPLRNQRSNQIDIVQNNNVTSSYISISIMCSLPPQYSSSYEYDSTGLPIKEYRGSQTFDFVYVERN